MQDQRNDERIMTSAHFEDDVQSSKDTEKAYRLDFISLILGTLSGFCVLFTPLFDEHPGRLVIPIVLASLSIKYKIAAANWTSFHRNRKILDQLSEIEVKLREQQETQEKAED